MRPVKPVWLAVVLVGLGAAVSYRLHSLRATPAASQALDEPVLPPTVSAASVRGLLVEGSGRTVRIVFEDGAYRVAELGGYPADTARVAGLVSALAEARLLEPKTARPERHAQLGLDAPDAGVPDETAGGVRVTLFAASAAPLVALVLGDDAPPAGAEPRVYLRRADSAQAYLARGPQRPPTDAMAWIDTVIARIALGRVRAIDATDAAGATVTLARNAWDGEFALASADPDDTRRASPTAARALAGGLAFLVFDTVRARTEADAPVRTTAFQLFDGQRIVVEAVGENLLAVRSDLVPEARMEDQRVVPIEETTERIEAFERTHAGWVYGVAPTTFDRLFPDPASLLESAEADGAGPREAQPADVEPIGPVAPAD